MFEINLGSILTLTSIFCVVLFWIRVTRVPPKLLNVIEIPFYVTIREVVLGASFTEIADRCLHYLVEHGFCRAYFRGRWEVYNGDPELLRIILYDTDSFDKFVPRQYAPNSLIDNMMGINIVQSDTEDWKKHRRIVNPPFKKGWNLSTFSECVEEVFERLGDGDATNVDVDDLIQRATVEALGREIMDIKFDTILTDKKHKFISYFNDIMQTAINPAYFIIPYIDNPWNPLRYVGYKKLQYVKNYFNQILEERKKKIAEDKSFVYKDVLSSMLASNAHDPDGLTDDDIRHNTLMFFLAGQDTTTLTICAALHLLAEHPEIQEIARKEVLTVFGKDEYKNGEFQIPTNKQLSKLEYIYAIMQETMRLYPAVTVINHRIALKDIHHRGHTIPAGTLVNTIVYAIHRNPKYFKNPNEFLPSRFLNGNIDTTKFESNWFSFSSGSRICLGATFSTTQQKIVLSYILRRYQVKPIDYLPSRRPLKVKKTHLLKTKNLRLNFEMI